MEQLAEIITNQLTSRQFIDAEKREIYCYGLKLLLADIINFTIIIASGILLNRFLSSVVFLITFCSVRKYSGGFHAKTFWLCRLTMFLTFFSVICAAEIIGSSEYTVPFLIGLNAFSVVMIIIFSPVKHPNKKLSEDQRKKNKRKAGIASVALAVISRAVVIKSNNIGITIALTLTAIVVLMFIGLIVTRGGKENA